MYKTLGSILLLFSLFFYSGSNAQTATKRLEGFNYKELVVNAESSAKNLPLIIAMHWMRSTPDEFSQYLHSLTNPARILLLEGNYPYKEGFSFYPTAPENYYKMSDDDKMSILLKESDKLAKFVTAASLLYPSDKKPIVIGASQGGDLSYMMAIRYNTLISLACPLMATIDNRVISKLKAKAPAPIVAFHGEEDPIVNADEKWLHSQNKNIQGR